jgi:cytochrome c2
MRAPFLCLFLFWLSCNTRPKPVDIGRNRVPGRLDFGAFTLKAPPDWKIFEEQGIDSYVGGLTNGTDTLRFDYGWYSHHIENFGDHSRLFAADTLDGFEAIISIPRQGKEGDIEMNIDLQSPNRFTIYGYTSDISGVLSILESIHFASGDPTKTNPLQLSRFVSSDAPNGKAMFQTECGICHSKDRSGYTPALSRDYVQTKGEKWIIDWLSHSYKQPSDPSRAYCFGRRGLKMQEIKEIIAYLKR